MRRPTATLALLTALALSGCGENPAENKPEAITGPARPETTVAAPTEAPADPAPDATASAEPASTPAPSTTPAAALAFSGDDGSTITFIGSKSIGGSHDGGFKSFRGTVDLAADGASVQKVQTEIDMDSIWSDDDKLTAHLKNQDFFDVPKYPQARFVTTEIRPGGANGASHTLVGNLTLHGVTKSIEVPATVTVTDGEARLVSEFVLKRSEFGMTFTGPGGVVRDEVVVKFDVKAPRDAAG